MSPTSASIFKPRKSNQRQKTLVTEKKLSLTEKNVSYIQELTKNDHYCVSKLPGYPKPLTTTKVLNGYTDNISEYSVAVSEDGIFVWAYKSTDSSPVAIEFPFEDGSSTVLPLATLISTSDGSTKDPGIVIVNASTGILKCYDSVQHSPALGLISDKNLDIDLHIDHKQGEFVTLVENVEPAGVVVVTSWKRVLLVGLNDFRRKSKLSMIEIMKPASRFMSKLFNSSEVNDDIVCVRGEQVNETGTDQKIVIQEKSGLIHVFVVNLVSSNGTIAINKSKTFSHQLSTYVKDNLDGFDKLGASNIQYFDIWKINNATAEDTYIILLGITGLPNETNNLVLATIKLDDSGVLVYGSHICNRFNGQIGNWSPKLFIPKPESTAFILVNNAIILTDLDYSYISPSGTVLLYKPRWEDIININEDVDIIGCGYENQSPNSNSALILLTDNSGVMRIERFHQTQEIKSDTINDPAQLVKSHIEQAIFYSSSESINFNPNGEFPINLVNASISEISDEIMTSTSQYLPQFSPTVGELLTTKAKLFLNLIQYAQKYHDFDTAIYIKAVHDLEKISCSLSIWKEIDGNEKSKAKLREIFKSVLTTSINDFNGEDDIVRIFFNNKTASIGQVLFEFLKKAFDADISPYLLIMIINKSLYEGVLVNELKYFAKTLNKKSWLFETDLLVIVENFFQTKFCNDIYTNTNPQEIRTAIGQMCNVLYYFFNEAIAYMKFEANANLANYVKWYNKNKTKWINCLLNNNLNEEAISLVERFEDFASLAVILEDEREIVVETFGLDSPEYDTMITKYYVYIERYQHGFAFALFDYYLKHRKVQVLLTGFPRYNYLLNEYFDSNPDKVAHVAWIKKLLDGEFGSASECLIRSTEVNHNETQSEQELKYSLAKLSAIASTTDDKISLDSKLFKIETNLIHIRIQKSLYQYFKEAMVKSSEGQDVKFNAFLKFINEKIDINTARSIFQDSFPRFVDNYKLDEVLLIDYLTFIKPSMKFSNGFSNAFKIASLIPEQKTYELTTKRVWCRLLAIAEDWEDLRKTDQETDEYIKRKLHNSLFYKTVSLINNKEIQILQEMLTEDASIFDQDDILMSELDKSFFTTTINNVKKYNLLNWIQSIRVEADLNI